jgi:prolyl oligopeptidase
VRVFERSGKPAGTLPIPAISAVKQLVHAGGDDVLFRNASYTEPPAWYAYSAKEKKASKTPLAVTSPVSFADAEAVRDTCTSKDGTKVPLNVLRKKGTKMDGSSPVILTGYGGYGISLTPSFNPLSRVWLDQGGAIAIANLRGGGELGEEWHLAGNLTRKQNVFDDFAACAKRVVEAGYTTPKKLATIGGSNGGLLMGAMLTQHPEMIGAVVSFVGIYDMLRVETTPNGQFNVTEFGTVKELDQFKALYAYSPYHHVADGTAYPPLLLVTGENDPRVDPFHSRKMAARLEASSSSAPVLLRATADAGHGGGTPLGEEIEQWADVYAFLFRSLGVDYKPVK